jgi:hypothetical protein
MTTTNTHITHITHITSHHTTTTNTKHKLSNVNSMNLVCGVGVRHSGLLGRQAVQAPDLRWHALRLQLALYLKHTGRLSAAAGREKRHGGLMRRRGGGNVLQLFLERIVLGAQPV